MLNQTSRFYSVFKTNQVLWCLSPRHNGWLKAGLLLRTVGVSGLLRKSDIRWPHCGNCINPRHFPKRWEKVALEFKRRVPLRDLPQLPSGNQISVFTDHQRRPLQTSAPSGVESGVRGKTKAGIQFYSWFIFESVLGEPDSLKMMNSILICVLCGLYGASAKGE